MTTPTVESLRVLKLYGFATALEEQVKSGDYAELSFEDRLALLVEREKIERENHSLSIRIGRAKFRHKAAAEDIRAGNARGLDKSTLRQLSICDWVRKKNNIIITGPSGIGKSFIATALAHKACLLGFNARYFRASTLLSDLASARTDGRGRRYITNLGKVQVLIIDDWALSSITEQEEKDLFELVEERHNSTSTIFTSQTPVKLWHGLMPNPTIADAILDRIVHNSYRLELTGNDSGRKDLEPKPLDKEVHKQT